MVKSFKNRELCQHKICFAWLVIDPFAKPNKRVAVACRNWTGGCFDPIFEAANLWVGAYQIPKQKS